MRISAIPNFTNNKHFYNSQNHTSVNFGSKNNYERVITHGFETISTEDKKDFFVDSMKRLQEEKSKINEKVNKTPMDCRILRNKAIEQGILLKKYVDCLELLVDDAIASQTKLLKLLDMLSDNTEEDAQRIHKNTINYTRLNEIKNAISHVRGKFKSIQNVHGNLEQEKTILNELIAKTDFRGLELISPLEKELKELLKTIK